MFGYPGGYILVFKDPSGIGFPIRKKSRKKIIAIRKLHQIVNEIGYLLPKHMWYEMALVIFPMGLFSPYNGRVVFLLPTNTVLRFWLARNSWG